MTTPKKKTETDERTAALADERSAEDADALGMEKARIAFGKTEQSLQMKVYRSTPEGDEALQSFEYDPDVHTEDFLRERFGAGKYRVRFRDLSSWKYLGQFTVRLGAVPGEPLPGAAPPAAAQPAGFDPLPYFMHEAEKKSDQFNQVMLAILAKGGSSGDGGATTSPSPISSSPQSRVWSKRTTSSIHGASTPLSGFFHWTEPSSGCSDTRSCEVNESKSEWYDTPIESRRLPANSTGGAPSFAT